MYKAVVVHASPTEIAVFTTITRSAEEIIRSTNDRAKLPGSWRVHSIGVPREPRQYHE